MADNKKLICHYQEVRYTYTYISSIVTSTYVYVYVEVTMNVSFIQLASTHTRSNIRQKPWIGTISVIIVFQ